MTIDITTPPQEPDIHFDIYKSDPLARFIHERLNWGWPHILLFSLLVYGIVEKFIIPSAGGYFDLTGRIGTWNPDIIALLTGFVVYPFILAFYIWTDQGISNLFVSLWRNKSFAGEQMTAIVRFWARANKLFNHPVIAITSLLIAIIIVLSVHFILWGPTSIYQPFFGADNHLHRVFALILVGLVGYAIGQIVIRQSLAIYLLTYLWHTMKDDLLLRPYHSDSAGGLGAIGQYATGFTFLILAVMLYIIGGSILPSLQQGSAVALTLQNPALIVAWAVYIVLVPGTIVLLVLPAHFAMKQYRNAQIDHISIELDKHLAEAAKYAIGDQSKLPDILKEIEHLKAYRALIYDFPVWPINVDVRRQIGASALIPPVAHLMATLALGVVAP